MRRGAAEKRKEKEATVLAQLKKKGKNYGVAENTSRKPGHIIDEANKQVRKERGGKSASLVTTAHQLVL